MAIQLETLNLLPTIKHEFSLGLYSAYLYYYCYSTTPLDCHTKYSLDSGMVYFPDWVRIEYL